MLTQRKLGCYVVNRDAHYFFTVKGNQPALQADIAMFFEARGNLVYIDVTPPDQGRLETRRIWCSTKLNSYLDFHHVGQVFLIERDVFHKKSKSSPLRRF